MVNMTKSSPPINENNNIILLHLIVKIIQPYYAFSVVICEDYGGTITERRVNKFIKELEEKAKQFMADAKSNRVHIMHYSFNSSQLSLTT